ncbi:hypothetical protein J2Z35_001203 [Acetoanaerobium pronyense]|uniref:Uncharacterized protein n=1 Tax=Acetoanaerobium pronyense TaxID=1482736 RepID=A0ABS4KLC6_9FIRM|nr:hypothetical protein [Acetoanaerobium pronyense]MBP2027409.1 hypothetical protein [Acetoanaerobium pronyense]
MKTIDKIKKILELIKSKINNDLSLILLMLEDILISIGIIIINATTYKINLNAGLYITGITFLALGIYFAKNPIKRG